jgi:ATP phosphoribosyltransferase regulatory subunit
LLGQAGVTLPDAQHPGRSLRLFAPGIELIIAKPSDVALYVAYGAADCGIGGRDILVEADLDVVDLLDLRFGACSFVVAAPEEGPATLDDLAEAVGTVRVATKYPRLARRYFDQMNIQAEFIKLGGNIELAPLIGMTDCIVDLTSTGRTLEENGLRPLAHILESSARFVANPVRARSDTRIPALARRLSALVAGRDTTPGRAHTHAHEED